MSGYAGWVMILHFIVELLLLMGADRLYGQPGRWERMLLGAGLSGVYAGACLLLRFSFLSDFGCRILCLAVVAWVAFGLSFSALRRGAVFVLLNLALDGIASGYSKLRIWHFLIAVAAVLLIFVLGFHGRGTGSYVPVELTYGEKSLRLVALQDTGNTLRDPVTGRSVMILGADAARQLIGLTQKQLESPLESIVTAGIPGLRLIPYHTVGESTGFMLGLKIRESKIGNRKGSCLVAFAPNGFEGKGIYQALTGGYV